MSWKRAYREGLKSGIPIGMGYLPVSFTFGFLAVSGGLPVWVAVMISLTNLTSAGQFAGTNLILAGSGYFEVALTTFVINIRYMLMSLSLSQKLERTTGTLERLVLAFGITDETFVVSSLHEGQLKAPFMFDDNADSGMEPGHAARRFHIGAASPGSAECDGNCTLCNVYCTDHSCRQEICSCTVGNRRGGCSDMHFKIHTGFWVYLIRVPGNSGHDSSLCAWGAAVSLG